MELTLAQQAIKAALKGSWDEAKRLNEELLKQNPHDTEALNRLARALSELGKIGKAAATYKKVLKLDPYNTIAQRALERLGRVKRRAGKKQVPHGLETSFLEEPGKTKTVSLIHLGDEGVINLLDTGQPLRLIPHAHRVSAQTEEGNYIGRLPDDLSRRIIKFTKSGNQYKALVRSVQASQVKIFIKEVYRAEAFADTPSFPSNEKQGYVSFTPPELVHEEKPGVATYEEEDEESNNSS